MVAELLENALNFSPPGRDVEIVGRKDADGYQLFIVDNGVGMSAEAIEEANVRLAGAESYTVAPSRYLGHYVVGIQAARLGAHVSLNPTMTGGVTATIDITSVLDSGEGSTTGSPSEVGVDQIVPTRVAEAAAVLEDQAPAGAVAEAPSPVAAAAPDGSADPALRGPAATSVVSEETTASGYKKRVRGANTPRTDVIAARGDDGGDDGPRTGAPDAVPLREGLVRLGEAVIAAHPELVDQSAELLAPDLRPETIEADLVDAEGKLVESLELVHEVDGRLERGTALAVRHLVNAAIGIVLALAVVAVDVRWLRAVAPWVYLAGLLGLVLVLTPLGETVNGSRSWLFLPGGFSLQPAELAKIGLVVGLAMILAEGRDPYRPPGWREVLLAWVLAALPVALIMLQPDLGSALVFGVLTIGVVATSGASWRWTAAAVGATVVAGTVVAGGVGATVSGTVAGAAVDRDGIGVTLEPDPNHLHNGIS